MIHHSSWFLLIIGLLWFSYLYLFLRRKACKLSLGLEFLGDSILNSQILLISKRCKLYITLYLYLYNKCITFAIILLFIVFEMFSKFRRMKNKPMNLDNITTYAFLGFEMQMIHTFHAIGRLYSDLNNYVESDLIDDFERIRQARQRNILLYTFCKKFNSHYSIDLIILLSCYQLYVLLVLFKLMNSLATSIATDK